MRHSTLPLLTLLAAAGDAANIGERAATPAICSTLASCYARFTQSSTASAYCSNFMVAATKSVTTTTTLSASTVLKTKIVTVKGTTTIPQTSTAVGASASYVTSYQPCTTATGLSTSTPSAGTPIAVKRQASNVPGCLQYMVGTAVAATSTACGCIVPAQTSTVVIAKTVTPKVLTYTWTGTVNIQSTVRPVSVVTLNPTYTVTMDPLPCALTAVTSTTSPSSTTPSSTAPPSSTTPTTTPTPETCANQGMQYQVYTGISHSYNNNGYSNFQDEIANMQISSPAAVGIAGSLGGLYDGSYVNGAQTQIYNSTTDKDWFSMTQWGYFLAPQTGDFTFFSNYADNFFAVWVGQKAISGFTTSNADGINIYPQNYFSFTVSMVAGQYYPIRTVLANGDGPYGYYLYAYAPDSSYVISPYDDGNVNLVQGSCDGTTAPAFRAFPQVNSVAS